jgi:hypothetical protein
VHAGPRSSIAGTGGLFRSRESDPNLT